MICTHCNQPAYYYDQNKRKDWIAINGHTLQAAHYRYVIDGEVFWLLGFEGVNH